MPCPRTVGSGGAMTAVPPCGRGGLPRSRPSDQQMMSGQFPRATTTGTACGRVHRVRKGHAGPMTFCFPRVDDGEWLVHAFSWPRASDCPRSFCNATRNFASSAETSKPGRTQGLFPVQKKNFPRLSGCQSRGEPRPLMPFFCILI